jgi:hypothetical protein
MAIPTVYPELARFDRAPVSRVKRGELKGRTKQSLIRTLIRKNLRI